MDTSCAVVLCVKVDTRRYARLKNVNLHGNGDSAEAASADNAGRQTKTNVGVAVLTPPHFILKYKGHTWCKAKKGFAVVLFRIHVHTLGEMHECCLAEEGDEWFGLDISAGSSSRRNFRYDMFELKSSSATNEKGYEKCRLLGHKTPVCTSPETYYVPGT
jgi:hypothetical protein